MEIYIFASHLYDESLKCLSLNKVNVHVPQYLNKIKSKNAEVIPDIS